MDLHEFVEMLTGVASFNIILPSSNSLHFLAFPVDGNWPAPSDAYHSDNDYPTGTVSEPIHAVLCRNMCASGERL